MVPRSHQRAVKLGMTSILKPGSYTRTTEQLLGLLPTPLSLPPSIPTTTMTFHLGFCDTGHPSKIWLPDGYIYMSFHMVMFSFSPFPSFTVTTLIFRIITLTIPYDSDDYAIHACIYITFISPSEARRYSELVYVFTILSLITWNII